jgi:hypothetical protein
VIIKRPNGWAPIGSVMIIYDSSTLIIYANNRLAVRKAIMINMICFNVF